MATKEKYQTVTDLIDKEGDVIARAYFLGVENLVERLEDMFLLACQQHDDKQALRLLSWLEARINDVALEPLCKDGVLPWVQEVEKWRNIASENTAKKIVGLWFKLPQSQNVRRSFRVDVDESEMRNVDEPTLPGVKEAILTKVAERWKATKDEGEADSLFAFLISVFQTRWQEEKKMLIGVLRKAADSGFPKSRTVRCLQVLHTSGNHGECDAVRVLAHGWINANNDTARLLDDICIAGQLDGCGNGAYEAVAIMAKETSELDRKMRGLIEKFNGRYGGLNAPARVEYPAPGHTKIIVRVQDRSCGPTDGDSWFHDQFDEIRTKVQDWRKENGNLPILLEVIGFLIGGTPSHKREQRLA